MWTKAPLSSRSGWSPWAQRWGLVVWLSGWLGLSYLEKHVDLANLAVALVLLSALASLVLHTWWAMLGCAVAVMAFNYQFVPPTGTFTVDLHQHLLLLVTMLAVSWIVTLLMRQQRQLVEQAKLQASRSQQLRELGEQLRTTDYPDVLGQWVQQHLHMLTGGEVALLLLQNAPELDGKQPEGQQVQTWSIGQISEHERSGLWLAATNQSQMGPGTGRHEEQTACYLPLRAQRGSRGAALLRLDHLRWTHSLPPDDLLHAQALCDLLGVALERHQGWQQAAHAKSLAQAQALRNTLLTAIAHDHRTPLATILGAASSLHDQGDRLTVTQQRQLAGVIVDEAQQLARLTDNTLQLARLDMPGVHLQRDWESVEEMVGTVMRRARQRHPHVHVQARVAPGLPLVYCDAILVVQLLDNLLDNAAQHAQRPDACVHVQIMADSEGAGDDKASHAEHGYVRVAVEDDGPGVPAQWKDQIFEPFSFVSGSGEQGVDGRQRSGAGLGLTVCRAIARVHGGQLTCEPGVRGGAKFVLCLPTEVAPCA